MPDIKNIKRNTNDFSFTETVASLVNNKEYKSGYKDLIEGKTNDKTYFWTALSAVGEEIGEVLYDNVLNYVNNAANINTCRLKPLTSIARVLGVSEFAILKNLNAIPLEVRNLMDIFSINRAYLLNINNFNSGFVKDLISSTLDTEHIESATSSLGNALSSLANEGYFLSGDQASNVSALTVFGSMSDEKYRRYVEESFFKVISEKVFKCYGDFQGDYIYSNLSGNISGLMDLYSLENLKNTRKKRSRNAVWTEELGETDVQNIYSSGGGIDISYSDAVKNYKKVFGIDSSFDQAKIVDDIEAGLDYLDNYDGGKLSVLTLEINERAARKYNNETQQYSLDSTTRYSYYDEKVFLHYLGFVNDTMLLYNLKSYSEKDLSEIKASYLTWSIYTLANNFFPYELDNTYSVISLSNNFTLQDSISESYAEYLKAYPDSSFREFIENFYKDPYAWDEDEQLSSVALTKNVIRITAMLLRDICFAIVDIREKLKTQAQRNYMTGTKLLIEYILDEYVASYLITTIGVKPEEVTPDKLHIKIQEYNDTTEYYNNNPFFSDIKNNPRSGSSVGTYLNDYEEALNVREYYLSALNIEERRTSASLSDNYYYDFMSAVFELGQTQTTIRYDDADGLLKIDLDKQELTDRLILSLDFDKISAENNFTNEDYSTFKSKYMLKDKDGYLSLNYDFLEDYWNTVSANVSKISGYVDIYNQRLSSAYEDQKTLALTYGGLRVSYLPWYNYKNQTYATFQSHPYLYNFIEHPDMRYPIENAFFGNANEDLIKELQTRNLSVYLEEFGNLRRIWRNSVFDFSGYKSRYEHYVHEPGKSNANLLYSVQHYDGTFYPPAIELYKKYWKDEIKDPRLPDLHGFDLLSAHMLLCVDNGCYATQSNEDILNISSMWHYYSQIPSLEWRKAERQHIVDQLIGLSSYILSVSSREYRIANNLDPKPHDVYKYGLDYEANSLILLKNYQNSNPTYEEKKQTTGELWFRLNAHPIGFPAFLPESESDLMPFTIDVEQISEFDRDNALKGVVLNNAVRSSFKNEVPKIYDFDLAGDGDYIVFAVPGSDRSYEKSLTYSSKVRYVEATNPTDPRSERTYYLLEHSGTETISTPENRDFQGYFQNEKKSVYLGYTKKNFDSEKLKSITVNAKEYPSEKDSLIFPDSPISFENLKVPVDLSSDVRCRLGFNGYKQNLKTFSLVSLCKVDKTNPITIQNFVGYNQISSQIEPEYYGKAELLSSTKEVEGQHNSFDMLNDYVLIHDVTTYQLKNKSVNGINPQIFALNSDASYIPQYCGLSGQNLFYLLRKNDLSGDRISYNYEWYREDKVPKQSLELLGYTFQELDDKIKDKEDTLHLDEYTGNITDFDENALLDTTLRVYEDYKLSNFIFETSNEGKLYDSVSSENQVSSFEIEIPIEISGLQDDNLSNYNVLLLNVSNGRTRNPIIAGVLSYDTLSNSLYNYEPTDDEESILSVGYFSNKQLRVVGTPNPFNSQNSTFAIDYSNHIFNICGFESELRKKDGKFYIWLNLVIREKGIQFALQGGVLKLFVYLNRLDEFEKYHYMDPFKLFPYNAALSAWKIPWKHNDSNYLYLDEAIELSDTWKGALSEGFLYDRRLKNLSSQDGILSAELYDKSVNSNHAVGHIPPAWYQDPSKAQQIANMLDKYYLMDNIVLSSVVSFNEVYELSSGQITWKISEEDKFRYDRDLYPPSEIDNLLYKQFGDTNKNLRFYGIFDLSNTYIFQLEDPVRIAERIAKIAVPIGSVAEKFDLVYEDYLEDKISVDVSSKDFLNYQEIVYDPREPIMSADEDIDVINSKIDLVDTIDEGLSILEQNHLYPEDSELNDNTDILDYHLLSVDPEEISEYLKLYVNWRKYENEECPGQEEIELFFNLPNLFMTPYSFRNKDGRYVPEYKQNTYLRLKSGEDKYLYITLQFKYYDSTGNVCGVRDLPILTYHIFNVSDDKPKFVITKNFEIDNRDGRYTYPDNNGNAKVYILVGSKTYGHDQIDKYIGWDNVLKEDFYANVPLKIFAPIPLRSLNIELAYERGKMAASTTDDDPELVFEPTISRPGNYQTENGYIYASFDKPVTESNLEFTLLGGTTIDEYSHTRTFPIEVLNASGEDINGNVPEFIFFNGGLIFDDNAGLLDTGAYLARELNYTPERNFMGGSNLLSASDNDVYFAGWINEEVNRALIRMYNIGRAGSEHPITTEDGIDLKTTGSRESRFDKNNDRVIIR